MGLTATNGIQERRRLLSILYKTLWISSGIFLCILFQRSLLQRLTSSSQPLLIEQEKIKLKGKESKLAALNKIPAFGFDNIVANYIFLDFLQYFGDDEARAEFGYDLTTSFFESVLSRTPDYRQFYLFLSESISLYAAQPHKSIKLIEQGLKELSPNQPVDGFYIWRYKAIDELLYLGDGKAAQQSFETVALWAEQSDHYDSEFIKEISRQTAQYLALNPQSKSAQVQAWNSVLVSALNERTQKQAIKQIEKLGGRVTVSAVGEFEVEFSFKDSH